MVWGAGTNTGWPWQEPGRATDTHLTCHDPSAALAEPAWLLAAGQPLQLGTAPFAQGETT